MMGEKSEYMDMEKEELQRSETGYYFLLYQEEYIDFSKEFVLKSIENVILPQEHLDNDILIDIENQIDNEGALLEDVHSALLRLEYSIAYELSLKDNHIFTIQIERTTFLHNSYIDNNINKPPKDWGIKKVNAHLTKLTGKDVKVAVLDTGFNENHPDFNDRNITIKDFTNTWPDDYNGHGTFCVGLACGNTDVNGIRYGIATESDIYVGKVLDDYGYGKQGNIIKGIKWAVDEGCNVISISIGTQYAKFEPSNDIYHRYINYAIKNNCFIVSGVGNDSNRSKNMLFPITSPADAQLSVAVSATDINDKIINEANTAITFIQQIHFSAPGKDVYSSWSTKDGMSPNVTQTGTSMATAYIAGIIAMLWQEYMTKEWFYIFQEKLMKLPTIQKNDPSSYGKGILLITK